MKTLKNYPVTGSETDRNEPMGKSLASLGQTNNVGVNSFIKNFSARLAIATAVAMGNMPVACATDELTPAEGTCFNGDGTPCNDLYNNGSVGGSSSHNNADGGLGGSAGDGGSAGGTNPDGGLGGSGGVGGSAGGNINPDGGLGGSAGDGGSAGGTNPDGGVGGSGGVNGNDAGNAGDPCQSDNDCQGFALCCGNVCADITTDEHNCGTCGTTCAAPTSECWAGECSCPFPTTLCGSNACVDTASDESNCGGCGNVCDMGQTCQNGKCVK
jgi:hypothetical protein